MENLNKDLVVSSLIPELAKHDFEKLFQEAKTSLIIRETLSGTYPILSKLRIIYDALLKRKELEDKDDKERMAARRDGYNIFLNPLKEFLMDVEPKLVDFYFLLISEEKAIQKVIDEQNAIKQKHLEFVNDTIKNVLSSSTNKDLVSIQKLVGSEQTRKEYSGYDPIKLSCKKLLELIESRKTIIKENDAKEKEYAAALQKEDYPAATLLREQIEDNKRAMTENGLEISKDAFKQVESISLVKNDVQALLIKPVTHRWSYEITDEAKLKKSHPEFFTAIDDKAVKKFFESKKDYLETGVKHNIDGLTIYYKPYFVAPSK